MTSTTPGDEMAEAFGLKPQGEYRQPGAYLVPRTQYQTKQSAAQKYFKKPFMVRHGGLKFISLFDTLTKASREVGKYGPRLLAREFFRRTQQNIKIMRIIDRGLLLRSGYMFELPAPEGEKKFIVGYTAPYAKFVDGGTRPHWPPRHKIRDWLKRQAKILQAQTTKTKAASIYLSKVTERRKRKLIERWGSQTGDDKPWWGISSRFDLAQGPKHKFVWKSEKYGWIKQKGKYTSKYSGVKYNKWHYGKIRSAKYIYERQHQIKPERLRIARKLRLKGETRVATHDRIVLERLTYAVCKAIAKYGNKPHPFWRSALAYISSQGNRIIMQRRQQMQDDAMRRVGGGAAKRLMGNVFKDMGRMTFGRPGTKRY